MRILIELDVEEATLGYLLDRRRSSPALTPPVTQPPPANPTQDKRWLRVKEAAQYASVSVSAIYGGVRLLKEWIDDWLSKATK
jgi:hypothetical protein